MAENSAIEWTHHTFNPWRGCTKVSDGCRNCYAERQAKRNPAVLGIWGDDGKRVVAAENYWQKPLKWNREAAAAGERRRVFCASMADVFEDRPELVAPRERLLDVIHLTPGLDWLLLTKRPENTMRTIRNHASLIEESYGGTLDLLHGYKMLRRWIDGTPPHNIWLGTSVENQETADERIPHLLEIPARVRFLSCEPLIGPVDLWSWFSIADENGELSSPRVNDDGSSAISWVIVGGESGPGARPMHPDWVRSIRDQCLEAPAAFFFKQWGAWRPVPWRRCLEASRDDAEVMMVRVGKKVAGRMLDGRTWDEMPQTGELLGGEA